MALDDLVPEAAGETSRDRERWTGVYIGVLAVLLAICAMGGGNAAKDATLKNIAAANTWAFFQAKNMRRHVLRVRVDEMQLKIASEPDLPATARAAIETKIAEYKKQDDILTRDPEREPGEREGLDQLWERGKALEVERDIAMQQDPYFDYGEALLQIAIVLASISIITRGTFLLAASAFLGIGGAILTLNGFTLAFTLPWL